MTRIVLVVVLVVAALGDRGYSDGHRYPAKVIRVIDGDTLVADVTEIDGAIRQEHVRFAVIDAPERNTAAGKVATKRVKELLDGKEIEIETTGARSHHRLVATVWIGTTNVCDLLLSEKLAVKWP